TIVDEKFHVFPDWQGQAGGNTRTPLLAESHLAIHTLPERPGGALDVYVCNFTGHNTPQTQQLFDALMVGVPPHDQVVNRLERGDLHRAATKGTAIAVPTDGAQKDELIFDWLNAHAGYGYAARERLATVQSPYQRVEVYDTHQFGRLFRLDGRLMTSEG